MVSNLILRQVKKNIMKSWIGNKWTKRRKQNEREVRNATQRYVSMEATTKRNVVFVSFGQNDEKNVSSFCLIPLLHVCFFFQCETSKQNHSKCVSLSISSGYIGVSRIWWEFLFFGRLQKKGRNAAHGPSYKKKRTYTGERKRKKNRRFVDIIDNRCNSKRQKSKSYT